MRRWTRAIVATLCGSCPTVIQPGEPMLVFELPGIKRHAVRCAATKCAEDAVPLGLPLLPARMKVSPIVQPMTKLRNSVGALAFDWKAAQFREPGEDD